MRNIAKNVEINSISIINNKKFATKRYTFIKYLTIFYLSLNKFFSKTGCFILLALEIEI